MKKLRVGMLKIRREFVFRWSKEYNERFKGSVELEV